MLSRFYSPAFQGSVLTVLLHVCINLAGGINIDVIPKVPVPGQTVTLSVTGITGNIRFSTWYKGESTSATDQILNYFPPDTEIRGEKYFPSAKGQANGSLVITNVNTTFAGFYTVQVQTNTLQQYSKELTVNGIAPTVLPPFALLLGMVLFSALNFL
ncbi:pregnancy-specific glycoprotein 22-like [Mixophyes fleayi]|uniref:pregnancy-specific glycoprotein 22-like n=1 Tax=Mixophyes fleayi TaxID=3061075 RepID=UPI003F4E213B